MLNIFTSSITADKVKIKDNICKEKLIQSLTDLTQGNRTQLTEEDIGCRQVADAWNEMVNSLCNNRGKCIKHLNKLNESVEHLTQMDFAKELIEDVRKQKEALETMASNSQEMAASVDEVANRAQNVAVSAEKATKISEEGSENITKAFGFVENSFAEIDVVNSQMQSVMEKTKKINQIVDIVKGIAEQTNLLALNAAIEAARAGEQGRGFAVVADEVRNLAEHTKNSVADIQQNITLLDEEINQSVAKIEETSNGLHQGKTTVDEALSSIKGITSIIKEVNDNVNEIAANTEEQTAVTQNFAGETNRVAGFAEKLINEADKTGRAIFDVSKMCNNLKITVISEDDIDLGLNELLDVCKTDHLMWRWRVYNMLLGYEEIDADTIGTHHDCRLGKWYYGEASNSFKEESVFKEMEQPHIELHKLAKEAAVAYQRGDTRTAEKALEEMDKCSRQVVQALDNLKTELVKIY